MVTVTIARGRSPRKLRGGREAHRQRAQPTVDDVLFVLWRLGEQVQAAEPPDERREGDLALDAGERRAEAEVDAEAEGEMAAVASGDVEPIGFGEGVRVAVRGADEDHRLPALLDRPPRPRRCLPGRRPRRA